VICLGLDFGARRVGVAASDELGRFAEPIGCIAYRAKEELWSGLQTYLDEQKIDTIVIGLPVRTSGEQKIEAKRALRFAEEVKKKVSCEVITWDERFTTKEAERILREYDFSPEKRKQKRDALAAAIMLQNYLDFKRIKGDRCTN